MKLMSILLLLLTIFLNESLSQRCNNENVVKVLRRPVYDFSVRLLDRIAEDTGDHFVFSPLATWLQMVYLAQGTKGLTLREIKHVVGFTKFRFKICYRKSLKRILEQMKTDLKSELKTSSFIVVDKFYKVKDTFIKNVKLFGDVNILSENFAEKEKSAMNVNQIVESDTGGIVKQAIYPNDFDYSFLLLAHVGYFRSTLKHPFNAADTVTKDFYSEGGKKIGEVYMMTNINQFHYTEIPAIRSKVLELPCENQRVTMLLFLPLTPLESIQDLFYLMKRITMQSIFNKFERDGKKLVEVRMPRFNISVDLDIRELLYDMGIKRVFYPEEAELKRLSDYTMNASLVAQTVTIEVIEDTITVRQSVGELREQSDILFEMNRPFAFMLVDKRTKFILSSGMYSEPSK